ncbi:hypothetical protein F5Y07DRAFT_376033 [Xylaria sp. FL0933]|nr:hypothetical protein F5Y07DRAFT_376033 [Xylaria sp. FL0933]
MKYEPVVALRIVSTWLYPVLLLGCALLWVFAHINYSVREAHACTQRNLVVQCVGIFLQESLVSLSAVSSLYHFDEAARRLKRIRACWGAYLLRFLPPSQEVRVSANYTK